MGDKGFSLKGFMENFNQSSDAKDGSNSENNSRPDDTNVSFSPLYYEQLHNAFTVEPKSRKIPSTTYADGKPRKLSENDIYRRDTKLIVSATDEDELNTDFDLEAFEVQYYEVNGQKYSGIQLINPAASYKNYTPAALNRGSDGIWVYTRPDGASVPIGNITLDKCYAVNPHPDLTYDALFCIFKIDGRYRGASISYQDIMKNNVYQPIRKLLSCDSDPNFKNEYAKYIFNKLVYEAPFNNDKYSILTLPTHAGWISVDQKEPVFAHYGLFHPKLYPHINSELRKRRLLKTDLSIQEIVQEYTAALPKHWKSKALVAVRVASLLLYYFEKADIRPDQMIVIETPGRICTQTAISLLKTSDYKQGGTPSIVLEKNDITSILQHTNDGLVLLEDTAANNEMTKLNHRLSMVERDITNTTGTADTTRHMIAILSENPDRIIRTGAPLFISLSDLAVDRSKINELRRLSGLFDFALIRKITGIYVDSQKDIDIAIEEANKISVTTENEERIDTIRAIYAAAVLLKTLNVVTADEVASIQNWLTTENSNTFDAYISITNDFIVTFNNLIRDGRIKVVGQSGPPYYKPKSNMAFLADGFVNFEKEVLSGLIIPNLRTSAKINSLKNALETEGILYGTNNKQRKPTVETSDKSKEIVAAYSVSEDILDDDVLEIVNESAFDDKYYSITDLPRKDFVPIIFSPSGAKAAGMKIAPDSDENFHMYVCGASRSGKTVYLMQQALFRAFNGEQVIIFDNKESFSRDRWKKVFKEDTQSILTKYVDYYNIGASGIPVDLYSLDYCKRPYEKTNRLYSILSTAAKIKDTSDKQKNKLTEIIDEVLIETKANDIIQSSDILKKLDKSDDVTKELRGKLEPVLKMIDYSKDGKYDSSLPMRRQSWGDFLKKKKKIVIISSKESLNSRTTLTDMLLASLYEFKDSNKDNRFTVIIDELLDQNIEKQGAINKLFRKVGKLNISMLVAAQTYSNDETDRIGAIVKNAGIKVFFSYDEDNISDISALLSKSKSYESSLSDLEQGECIIKASFYSKHRIKNDKKAVIRGWTPSFTDTSFFNKPQGNSSGKVTIVAGRIIED